MSTSTEITPGLIFYAYYSIMKKEKVGYFDHSTLILQVAGQFTFETSKEKVSIKGGEMLLIRKNQVGQIVKAATAEGHSQTIIIFLKEDLLRQFALEQRVEAGEKYAGKLNLPIPENEYLQGFFQSLMPYIRNPEDQLTQEMGMLKVSEAVRLLLHALPELKDFLFDFSEPYKIDLEKFMLSNYHFNVPIDKFAQLTGRSLAGFKRDFQKVFGDSPRHWLLDKRLQEARHLIENKNKKASAIYLDLGFETLSHFSNSFKKKFGNSPRAKVYQGVLDSE
jgi:AraC-like DNA-binding protein